MNTFTIDFRNVVGMLRLNYQQNPPMGPDTRPTDNPMASLVANSMSLEQKKNSDSNLK